MTASPPSPAPPFFQAQDLTKVYRENQATIEVLKGLNLELAKGEAVAIVGSSGTGKTTLLHILGGLDRPDAGQILVEGRDVLAKNEKELSRYRNHTVGFVFQFHNLLPEFTALENVMMPGLIAGRPRRQNTDEAAELLARVGLAERITHKVGELSGGEQQRVALARALIMKPAILLADEPTGNLDPKTGLRVFDLLREMNRDCQVTTIMVTHNHELAREMDRCLELAEGQLHERAL